MVAEGNTLRRQEGQGGKREIHMIILINGYRIIGGMDSGSGFAVDSVFVLETERRR